MKRYLTIAIPIALALAFFAIGLHVCAQGVGGGVSGPAPAETRQFEVTFNPGDSSTVANSDEVSSGGLLLDASGPNYTLKRITVGNGSVSNNNLNSGSCVYHVSTDASSGANCVAASVASLSRSGTASGWSVDQSAELSVTLSAGTSYYVCCSAGGTTGSCRHNWIQLTLVEQ